MRNAFLGAVLSLLGAMSSQAVVISWSGDSLPAEATSARLVYITNGETPSYSGGAVLQNGSELASASGYAIDNGTLFPQMTTDGITRSSGAYYIVLFNSDASQYAVGDLVIAYNDSGLGSSEFDPGAVFSSTSYGSWTPVPEPTSAALLCLGAAALALRRRKRA